MKAVDVWRDHDRAGLAALPLRDYAVSIVGLTTDNCRAPLVVKVPNLVGVPSESALACVLLVVVLLPDASMAAVGGDAALGRESCSCEKDDPPEAGEAGQWGWAPA